MTTTVSDQLANWSIHHRRHLHQHPEVSGQEFQTCAYIKNCLEELGIELLDFRPPSIVGFLRGTHGQKTIALRADIDALPIDEEGDKPYLSQVPGVAHLCGHDGHTAILLAVARWMAENREEIRHNVLFLFQSSEEALPSGAELLVQQGAMDLADVVFGVHLMQTLPFGKLGVCHGAMMSTADDFTITIGGKGGHGSMPHDTIDPIYIASHIIQGLQGIISRRVNSLEPAVISVGRLEAGNAYNVIPNQAVMGGTFRTLSAQTREFISAEMRKMVEGICQGLGGTGSVTFGWGAPPVVNDEAMSRYAEQIAIERFGQEAVVQLGPNMGSEDFSYYLEQKPGSYLFVGIGGENSQYPHHHPRFDLDERAIPTAIEWFIHLVKEFV